MRQLIYPMQEKYQDYLSDESRLVGQAVNISFPENEEEIIEVIKVMRGSTTEITVQGGKTGINGSAVPIRGHILNLSQMNRVKKFSTTAEGNTLLQVEPGVTLLALKRELAKIADDPELFWPPDPTENLATVGGIASCNAKGLCSYLYGETRNYIAGARVVQSNGTVKEIRRGDTKISFLGRQKDLLDVYLGGEGMFGTISELTLKLQPKPKEKWGIIFFFAKQEDVNAFADDLRQKDICTAGASVAAAEYMDRATIELIQEEKEFMPKIKELPDIDSNSLAIVYVEIHGMSEAGNEAVAEKLLEIAVKNGSNPERAWAVIGDNEVEKLRAFRHAAVDSINLFTARLILAEPEITRLSMEMKFGDILFQSAVTKYQDESIREGLKFCIFGDIRENHLHVNLLPDNYLQYVKGKNLFMKWADSLKGRDSKIVMGNGIGKLKKSLFMQMAAQEQINEIIKLKNMYDPTKLWNPGNMIL